MNSQINNNSNVSQEDLRIKLDSSRSNNPNNNTNYGDYNTSAYYTSKINNPNTAFDNKSISSTPSKISKFTYSGKS